ncbi:MAG: hypothetical protein V4709_00105 [Pseudomonadota bacterium]
MNTITLAQTALIVNNLRTAVFWAELDAAIQRLHGTVLIHASGSRDYRLPAIEMRVCVVGSAVTATWISRSPVLDSRGRIDLRQSADAWLDTLAALMLRPAPVSARVQAASALLAAGFDSVSVSSTGATDAAMAQIPAHAVALAA